MSKPSGAAPTIFWFRQDLRLSDNPSLAAALRLATDGGVMPVYIWAPVEEKRSRREPPALAAPDLARGA